MAGAGLIQALIDQAQTNPVFQGTGSMTSPRGTAVQRPGSPVNGMIRYNSTVPQLEGYAADAWVSLAVAGGGAPNDAQYLVLAASGSLSAERLLAFDADDFDVTDGGAGGNYDVDLTATLKAIRALAVTDGNFVVGNGATWVAESGVTARASLGLAIGTNVQAYDADLAAIAGLATTDGNIIVGNGATWVAENGATARTSLGLGSGDSPTFAGLTVSGDATVGGNLLVDGAAFTGDFEMSIADNHVYMNAGYEVAVAQTGGLVVNYLPTATNDTVAAGGFTAGAAGVSNPTVATAGAGTFAPDDLIQITGATALDNRGLYEVLSHVGNTLTIRGIGLTATVEDFPQNQFTTSAGAVGTIRKVTVSVLRAGTDGGWEVGAGSATGLTFNDLYRVGGTDVTLADGGTNASLTASNGGIFYSTATAGAILAGTATAGQLLLSGATAAPTWSTTTYPSTNAINTLLYASAADVMAALATANGGVLNTGATGVPSITATPLLGVAGTTAGTIRFSGLTSGVVTIQTAAVAGTWSLTLPVDDGTTGQYLQTDGAGVTSWQTVAAGVTLDGAYDFGGAGVGRTITVDTGAVDLDNRQTTGTIQTIRTGAAITLTGSLTGLSLEMDTNLTVTNFNVTGATITLPGPLTNTGVGTYTYRGLVLSSGGLLQHADDAGGTDVLTMLSVTTPNIIQGTGNTVTATGISVICGALMGGTQKGISIAMNAATHLALDVTTGSAALCSSAGTLSLYGVTGVTRSAGWTISNETEDRTFDANLTSLDELADIVATLIKDVAATGLIGAVV